MKFINRNIKKIVCGLLVVCSILGLAGCSGDEAKTCTHNYYLGEATSSYKVFICSECDKSYKEVVTGNESTDTNNGRDYSEQAKTMTAVSLSSLDWFNQDNLFQDKAYDTTSNVGTPLRNAYRTGTSYYGGAGEGQIQYYLDGGYEKLTGILAVTNEFKDTNFEAYVEIYADGVPVYTSDVITGGSSKAMLCLPTDLFDIYLIPFEVVCPKTAAI